MEIFVLRMLIVSNKYNFIRILEKKILLLPALIAIEVIDPRIPVGTGPLAGCELSLIALVFQHASLLLPAAMTRTVRKVAVEDWRLVDVVQRLGIAHPVDEFLTCDKVDIREGKDGVEEIKETFLAVGSVKEPGSVEEEREGGLGFGVMLQEVLSEDLLDGVGILLVEAAVRHGASATADILDHRHGNLPHARMGELGTGLN